MPYPMSSAQTALRGRLIPAKSHLASRSCGVGALGASDTPPRITFQNKKEEAEWYGLLHSYFAGFQATQHPTAVVLSATPNPKHPELGTRRKQDQDSLLDYLAFWLNQAGPPPHDYDKAKDVPWMKRYIAQHPRGAYYVSMAFDETGAPVLILSKEPPTSASCAEILPDGTRCDGLLLVLNKGEPLPDSAKKLLASGESETSWGMIAAVAAGVFLLGTVVMTGMSMPKRATANRPRRSRRRPSRS